MPSALQQCCGLLLWAFSPSCRRRQQLEVSCSALSVAFAYGAFQECNLHPCNSENMLGWE